MDWPRGSKQGRDLTVGLVAAAIVLLDSVNLALVALKRDLKCAKYHAGRLIRLNELLECAYHAHMERDTRRC
jgi:hypothetical protein